MSRYWDTYWKRQKPKKNCVVCHDMGVVSGANSNHTLSMEIMPCPMKCESSKKYIDKGG